MKYIVYTDAAVSPGNGVSGCGYCILTDDTYVDSDSVRVTQTTNPTHAEVVSIGLAAACLIDKVDLQDGDCIEFNSDCLSAVEFCKRYSHNKSYVPCSAEIVRNSMAIIRKLAKDYSVEFHKVHGHKDKLNPNTFVDRLAKLPVRRE